MALQQSIPEDKRRLSKDKTVKLTKVLYNFKNHCFQKYLGNLSFSADANHSLWKAARSLTHPSQTIPPIRITQGGWARSPTDNANVFAFHLIEVFKPHCLSSNLEKAEILDYLLQMSQTISFPDVPLYRTLYNRRGERYSTASQLQESTEVQQN